MKNLKNKNQGFTLIELLVVVAIIAILALVVLLAINPVELKRRSNDSRRLNDIGAVRRGLDLALADGENLPGTPLAHFSQTTAAAVGSDIFKSDNSGTGNLVGTDISKYLSTIPQDPQYENVADLIQTTSGACPGTAATTAKSAMVYTFESDGSTYVLTSKLESLDNCKAANQDGGPSAAFYEMGTDPGLDL